MRHTYSSKRSIGRDRGRSQEQSLSAHSSSQVIWYMPDLGISTVIPETVSSLDFGFFVVASSHATETEEGDGVLDPRLILRTRTSMVYDRPFGYPVHFSLDGDLFSSIQGSLFD